MDISGLALASERWGAFILKMCWGVVGSGYLRTGLGQRAVGSAYFEDVLGSCGEWIFEDWPWPASGGERLF